MGNYQSEIDQMKKDAMEREEALELWTQEQNKARDKEDREREARHKKEFEELARRTENQIKQMGIDMKRREDERARAKEEKTKKEKAEELAIRKEKERLEQIRAEEEEEKRLRKIKKLRTEIKEMKPGESFEFPLKDITFPKRLNIGVFGTTGVGKTSLINSLKFAVNGVLEESQREQAAPASFQGGHTTRRLAVRITQYLTFVDNRGVGAEDLVKDGAAEEIIRQMGQWKNHNAAHKLCQFSSHSLHFLLSSSPHLFSFFELASLLLLHFEFLCRICFLSFLLDMYILYTNCVVSNIVFNNHIPIFLSISLSISLHHDALK